MNDELLTGDNRETCSEDVLHGFIPQLLLAALTTSLDQVYALTTRSLGSRTSCSKSNLTTQETDLILTLL